MSHFLLGCVAGFAAGCFVCCFVFWLVARAPRGRQTPGVGWEGVLK